MKSGPSARRSADGIVRVGPAVAIPSVLRSLGAEPSELLAELGLDLGLLDDPENTISFAARGHLASHCVARTGCQHFGLLVGQQAGLSSLGLVGILVRHSPDVGTALRALVRFFHLHAQGGLFTLTVENDLATLDYAIYQPGVKGADQLGDGAVTMAFNIMRELGGAGWNATEIRLARRKPEDVGPYRRYFRTPLRFDAGQDALVFTANCLSRRLFGDDPELARLLEKQIRALEATHVEDFPEQIRRVLRTALLTGHSSAGQVAALFGVHGRTLHRRLSTFGTSFQELVDDGRFAIAGQLLEHSALDVGQVAATLGYSEPSAFTRAFRRWSGVSPTHWRAERLARGTSGGPTAAGGKSSV